mmetsp:Transcript_6987/g.20523  ORF Transcript_6987/g.20523 Transcript_6987/m.20523 type:complete len:217 (-) Transcript_6987:1107-1757(-)
MLDGVLGVVAPTPCIGDAGADDAIDERLGRIGDTGPVLLLPLYFFLFCDVGRECAMKWAGEGAVWPCGGGANAADADMECLRCGRVVPRLGLRVTGGPPDGFGVVVLVVFIITAPLSLDDASNTVSLFMPICWYLVIHSGTSLPLLLLFLLPPLRRSPSDACRRPSDRRGMAPSEDLLVGVLVGVFVGDGDSGDSDDDDIDADADAADIAAELELL